MTEVDRREGLELLAREVRDFRVVWACERIAELEAIIDRAAEHLIPVPLPPFEGGLDAGVEAACNRIAELEAELEKCERHAEQDIAERDAALDALQKTHVALGGDGEWAAKPGRLCRAWETGDLRIDAPALADRLRRERDHLLRERDEAVTLIEQIVSEKDPEELAARIWEARDWYFK
jgi:hypothetical protein